MFHTFAIPKFGGIGLCSLNRFADVAQLARATDL